MLISHSGSPKMETKVKIAIFAVGAFAFAAVYFAFNYNLVIPYFPLPSDDVVFREYVAGHSTSYLANDLVLLKLFDVCVWVVRVFANDSSTFDQLAITCVALNFIGWFAIAIAILSATEDVILALVGLVFGALLPWTFLYNMLITNASGSGTFFGIVLCVSIFLSTAMREGRWKRTKFIAILLSWTLVGQLFASSVGPLWTFAGVVFTFVGIAFNADARVFVRRLQCVEFFSLSKIMSSVKAHGLAIAVAAVPWVSALVYFLNTRATVFANLYNNAKSSELTQAAKLYGQPFGNLPFSATRTFVYHMSAPFVGGLVAIFLIWVLIRVHKRGAMDSIDGLIAATGITLVVSILFLEILPFTKFGRSLFPLSHLSILLAALLLSDLARYLGCTRRMYIVLAAAIVLYLPYDTIYIRTLSFERFGLARFLHPFWLKGEVVVDVKDPHAIPIIREFSTLDYPALNPLSTVKALPSVDKSAMKPPFVVVMGPRGKDSGKSVMYSCRFPDFAGASNDKPPIGATILRFPYAAYMWPLDLEQEVCENLFFRGKIPRINQSDKEVEVWLSP